MSIAADNSVSVVIPTHNRAAYILDAVQSALNQGPPVAEVIVVDDGSTDDTLAKLQSVSDPRLRVLQQSQRGPAAARNTGWQSARGAWIQFLDSDDALAEGALTALLDEAARSPGRIPFGQASVHGQRLDTPPVYSFCFAHRSGNLLRELCFYSAGTILSCLLPKASLAAVGGFSDTPETHFCEDFDLALRLALHYEFAYVPRVTYRIRMHDANRHRAEHRQVWESSMHCVERRLAGAAPGALRRRARAYYGG
ncbi:MAG: glycosyltransferase family 2 protein, partial [Verrucomicrobiota bacterium]